ncbi:hypothetical protein FAZ69_20885 [Trinickia terrae]|uniref:Secretion system X translation initiation factor n=1 Tax=Trinickia terrae TaxID=2571161 RepID=A0A4V5PI76_9BURK|nr:hypothetical protein [Trinickia terrae]TKC86310.1 hypothetical protein FAZ69_20885 [Trinickia terrae]
MKSRHIVLALAFLVCAALLVFGNRSPSDPVVEAAPRARAPGGAQSPGAAAVAGIAALRSRAVLFGGGNGHHELFGSLSIPSPLPSAAPPQAEVPPLPPGPVVPSIPFIYLGKKSSDGGWEVYLARGDDTLIVHEQSIIDGAYRVQSIAPPTMKIVYLPAKLVQTVDIGSAD